MAILLMLLVFILIGLPIAFSIGLTSVLFLVTQGKAAFLQILPQKMFTALDSFPFLAVPFFILAGNLMNRTGISKDLIVFVDKLVGHIRGGLAHVNILASVLFAGITGAAVADASALGSVEVPMMVEGGYDVDFSAAVTAASSVVGPIIPPSIIMVIYALVASNVSIAGLFVAGYVPGLLMAGGMMLLCYYYARKRNYPKRATRASTQELLAALKKAAIPLLMPIIIMGGILGGIFTATEASAVAVGYAIVVGMFVLKTLKLRDLPEIFLESAITTAVVQLIAGVANVLSWVLTTAQVPQNVSAFFLSSIQNPTVFMLFVVALLLVVGLFFDPAAGLIITTPILLPTALSLGIDPLHFGIVTTVALNIGLVTPPVGVCLYVTCGIADISLERLSKAIFPFIVLEVAIVVLLAICPKVVLFLPNLLGYR